QVDHVVVRRFGGITAGGGEEQRRQRRERERAGAHARFGPGLDVVERAIEIDRVRAAADGERPRPAKHRAPTFEPDVIVEAGTSRRRAGEAERITGGAAKAGLRELRFGDAERQIIGDADPKIGRERERLGDLVARYLDLGGDVEAYVAGR